MDQQALNGIYHYIDQVLDYNLETRDVVFNDRIRVMAATLSPEFMNCGARGNTERATGFKMVEGWDFHGKTPTMTLRKRDVWMVTYADCIDMVGQFDVTFKLLPVPKRELMRCVLPMVGVICVERYRYILVRIRMACYQWDCPSTLHFGYRSLDWMGGRHSGRRGR